MKRERFKTGSVVFDRRRKTWNLLQWIDGKRKTKRIGTLAEFPTKGTAQRAAQAITTEVPKHQPPTLMFGDLAARYTVEKMPKRSDTNRTYTSWLKHRILPQWGMCALTDLQARPVEVWLQSLPLAPKSKVHIRGLLRSIWDYTM